MQPAVAETLRVPPTVSATAGVSPRAIRSSALAFSVAAHLALVAAFLFAPVPPPKEPEPLVRLVFAEPPPPPPPPAASAPSERAAPVVPQPRPKPVVEKKPVRPTVARKPVAKPVEAAPPVEPAREEPAAPVDVASGAAGFAGVPGGVEGGVEGGTLGGVVGGRGDRPIPVGDVARPPVLVKQVKPSYPPAARRRGIEGLVRLEAVLDAKGRIEQPVRVLESIPALDDAAITALRDWRFAPARDHGGEAVRVILEVPIRFVLR